jgi:chitin disaccharide deacetylase
MTDVHLDRDKLLIVHLDDMGSSHAANAAGRELLELGIATSASVMMPCDWAWDFVSWWREHSDHDIGTHLTLTCERRTMAWSALSDRGAAPSLYGADGLLHATSADVAEHARPADVAREIDRQVELALRWGMRPSHIDCHMWFVEKRAELFAAYTETAHRHGLVPHVYRRARESDHLAAHVSDAVPLVSAHPRPLRERRPGDTYEERRATVWETFDRMEPGLNVVPLHVAIDTPEIRAIMPERTGAKRFWRDRVWAYEIYRDPKTRQRIADAGLRLVSWGDVSPFRTDVP